MTNQEIIQEMNRIKTEAYLLFDLTPAASLAEVDDVYQRLVYTWHPDRCPNDPYAFERFQQICHAREIIHGGKAALQQRALANLFQSPSLTSHPIPSAPPAEPPPQANHTKPVTNPAHHSDTQHRRATPFFCPKTKQKPANHHAKPRANRSRTKPVHQHQQSHQPKQCHTASQHPLLILILFELFKFLLTMAKRSFEVRASYHVNTIIINQQHKPWRQSGFTIVC